MNQFFTFADLNLGETGCDNNENNCIGDNVVCSSNTCVCMTGYYPLYGICVPSKYLINVNCSVKC